MTLLTAFLLPALCGPVDVAEARRPNVVLILVDDQGYYDLGCYGATEVHSHCRLPRDLSCRAR